MSENASSSAFSLSAQRTKSRRTLLLVFLTCALPVAVAAVLYFFIRPETTNNYGTLLVPQPDVSSRAFDNINGEAFTMQSLKGKWVLVQIMQSNCDETCQNTLYYQRQARKTKGKDMDRIERVAFVTDSGPLSTLLLRQFPQVHFLRAKPADLAAWLPVHGGIVGKDQGNAAVQATGNLHDHVFVVDPLGHVMMRFPNNSTLDFGKFRKDLSRLLWASNIG